MSAIVDQLAAGGTGFAAGVGTVITGCLAGACMGPVVASASATSVGLKKGFRWNELQSSVAIGMAFTIFAATLASVALSLGSTTIHLAPVVVRHFC